MIITQVNYIFEFLILVLLQVLLFKVYFTHTNNKKDI